MHNIIAWGLQQQVPMGELLKSSMAWLNLAWSSLDPGAVLSGDILPIVCVPMQAPPVPLACTDF